MNRTESLRALKELASSPVAKWIGNRILDGSSLLQKCTRCGAEEILAMPPNIRGPGNVPANFDQKLFAWKRAFQIAHEACAAPAP